MSEVVGGSLIVGVGFGTNHSIVTSGDGITWTGRGNTIFSSANAVAWNGSLWVAVGEGTNDTIATSPDGITWTGRGKPILTNRGDGVAWNGNRWVAVGVGANDTIAYSDDGSNWIGAGKTILSSSASGVAWGNGLWTAVGNGSNDTIATSTDGITWIGRGKNVFSGFGRRVAWNGSRWVVVGFGTTHTIGYSDNGTTWTGGGNTIFSQGIGVAWNGSLWVAVGEKPGGQTTATSTDGVTWQPRSASGSFMNSIAWDGGQWIAGGTTIITSSNGISWSGPQTIVLSSVNELAWNGRTTGPQGVQGFQGIVGISLSSAPDGVKGPNGFQGPIGPQGIQGLPGFSRTGPIGATGSLQILNSTNNTLLTTNGTSGSLSSQPGLAFNSAGTELTVNGIVRTTPLITQIVGTSPSTTATRVTTSSTGQFVALIAGSSIFTSADFGATWIERTSAGSRDWTAITSSASGYFIAAIALPTSFSSTAYISTDFGATWTPRVITTEYEMTFVRCSSNGSVLLALGTRLFVSTDSGTSWANPSGVQFNIGWVDGAMSSDGTRMFAVGGFSHVYLSTNSGNNWSFSSASGERSRKSITCSSNGQTILATSFNQAFRSTDFGSNWSQTASFSVDQGRLVCSSNASIVFGLGGNDGGAVSGIYVSRTSGDTWTLLRGTPTTLSDTLACTPDGLYLYLGIRGVENLNRFVFRGAISAFPSTASLPSYSFSNNNNTGIYSPASNSFAISVAGTEDIRILSNGNVGIGLTNPSFQLQLSTDSAAKLTTNTWSTTSDSRVKNAIVDADISMCYDTLKQLKLRRFEWDSSWNSAIEDKHAIGFIAQEVKQYFPKAVKTMDMYGYSDFHTLDVDQIYKTMYGALAKLIQEKELLEERVRLLKGASM